METKLSQLYEEDETLWLEKQVELLQQHKLNEIDVSNLEVYLSDMAKSERKRNQSYMKLLIRHLLKWKYQEKKRTASWRATILENRGNLDELDKTDCKYAREDFQRAYTMAVEATAIETGIPAGEFPQKPEFTFDEMLDNNFWMGSDAKIKSWFDWK